MTMNSDDLCRSADGDDREADPGRQARDTEIIRAFGTALGLLVEIVTRDVAEAERKWDEADFEPGTKSEMAELRATNKQIDEMIHLLGALKKLHNQRIKDIKEVLDLFRPGRRRRAY